MLPRFDTTTSSGHLNILNLPSKLLGETFWRSAFLLQTWNPNDPCFDWRSGLLLEEKKGSNPKIEDKQVPEMVYSNRSQYVATGLWFQPI